MAYLTILALGGFGLIIAALSHFGMARERRAILAARAEMAGLRETTVTVVGTGRPAKAMAGTMLAQTPKRGSSRYGQVAVKHYAKRVAVDES